MQEITVDEVSLCLVGMILLALLANAIAVSKLSPEWIEKARLDPEERGRILLLRSLVLQTIVVPILVVSSLFCFMWAKHLYDQEKVSQPKTEYNSKTAK